MVAPAPNTMLLGSFFSASISSLRFFQGASARTVMAGLREGANAERYATEPFYIDQAGRWWPPAVAEAGDITPVQYRTGITDSDPGDGPGYGRGGYARRTGVSVGRARSSAA